MRLGLMLKKLVQGALRYFGLQLQRLPKVQPVTTSESQSKQTLWLGGFGVETVLDIGANTGQFAQRIRQLLPEAMIYSFEPLPDCFAQLQTNMATTANFKAFNIALGDQANELLFERNEFSPSSSFLKMADLHKTSFPYTRNTDLVTVTVRRLDDLFQELIIKEPILVKIDVQGYEDQVLRGGEEIIRRASVIVVETCFVVLYERQPLFNSIYQKLVSWGFTYQGAMNQLCSPQDGRPLQADSIFVRSDTMQELYFSPLCNAQFENNVQPKTERSAVPFAK